MAVNDLTGQNIQDTYQKIVQTDGTNLADGIGSALPIKFDGPDLIVSGALRAQSYIVSESIVNVSSGSTAFGDSADDSHTFTGNITASGNISASGDIYASNLILSASGIIAPSENNKTIKFMTKPPGTVDNGERLTIGSDLIEFQGGTGTSEQYSLLKMDMTDAAEIITFNDASNDVDFLIKSPTTTAFKLDANNDMMAFRDHVGIGMNANKWPTDDYSLTGTPDKQLMVAGVTHLTGSVEIVGPITTNITASGAISSSGIITALSSNIVTIDGGSF